MQRPLVLVGALAAILFAGCISRSTPSSKPVPYGPGTPLGQDAGKPATDLNATTESSSEPPPGTYGYQGGEPILPADAADPDALLRCRAADSFYKLSNPRKNTEPKEGALLVDYERIRKGKPFEVGKPHEMAAVFHRENGSRSTVPLREPPSLSKGILSIPYPAEEGQPSLFPNFEVYLTNADSRYSTAIPAFKVSTSAMIGNASKSTVARNWTKAEIALLTQPPGNFTQANIHPNVGTDTLFAGDAKIGEPLRYVEPKGLLIGLDYRLVEIKGYNYISKIIPIFSRHQPRLLVQRVVAKEGYAVGGFKALAGDVLDAIQIAFYRIKANGRLDPSDSYMSSWIGTVGKEKGQILGGAGAPVIGVHCRQGQILNAVALVEDQQAELKP
jgi:hypothetical protein